MPSVTHDPTTGNTFEIWFKDCTIDRANGPAFIVRDAKTGIVTVEQWAPDRADGPSSIQRDAKTGIVTFEGWYRNDKPDRADGPAFIWRDANTGKVTRELWYKDGKPIKPPSDGKKR